MSVTNRVARLRQRQYSTPRIGALLSAAGLLFAVLTIYDDVVQTVGAPGPFYLLVGGALVAGTLLARVERTPFVVALGAGIIAAGLAYYLQRLPQNPDIPALLHSNIALLTGQTILRITAVYQWVLVVLPGPILVCWYLVCRRRYTAGAGVGLALLCYPVLTGDAGLAVTTLGIVAGAGIVGFGDLDCGGWSPVSGERLALLLAVMAVAPFVLTVVPGGAGSAISPAGSGGQSPTLEENLVGTDTNLQVVGSVDQSPEVRFAVNSTRPAYWRTGSFDRYTGDGWVQTDGKSEYDPPLVSPRRGGETIRQEVEIRSATKTLPVAWRPIRVSDAPTELSIVGDGGIRAADRLDAGDGYRATSYRPAPTTEQLRTAQKEYPSGIESQYTQLPADTPDRVAAFTSDLVAETNRPYETARVIKEWLQTNREYDLDVERPSGNVADSFLFEMEAGYCTYYATTMATMLRSQNIPARVAVGYAPGEQVAGNRWVVRGLDSHAWVEVYFEDIGWVRFDPTPAQPRERAERSALETARDRDSENIDIPETDPRNSSENRSEDPETNETDGVPLAEQNLSQGPESTTAEGDENETTPVEPEIEEYTDDSLLRPLLVRERLLLGAVAVIGVLAGVRRTRIGKRLQQAITLRMGRRGEPRADIERAHERLLVLLERRHRPRRTGETVRQYLDDIGANERAYQIAEIRAESRYGQHASDALAKEATELFAELRRDPPE